MASKVVLVTGSRALTGKHGISHKMLSDHVSAGDLVVTGDADGVDKSARGFAADNRIACRVYALDGTVVGHKYLVEDRKVIGRWISEENLARIERAEVPLARNTAMVAACARAEEAFCLAFEASWSTTKGTKHTYSLAKRFGIKVLLATAVPSKHGSVLLHGCNIGEFVEL